MKSWKIWKKNDDKANDDDDNEDDDDIENDNDNDGMLCSMKKLPDATNYYQITYLAD
ncbi:hypothetical protein WUBG_09739 [Wuchereria bancrofti]|uniref:Uncharacterized protein n=1 Tax=Wuchereria bancrofti TaxID=6293 RepID=J9EAZ7_WUCBA|nr:hypothetical protein WUBG_09739 [Wuchereria bancrofti]